MSAFPGNFCLNEAKTLMSKITNTNVLNDMTDEALVTKFCDKIDFINIEINNDASFSVTNSWTSKRYPGTPNFKNVRIKCCPQIRKHTLKDNDGYVYVGQSRCKIFITFLYHSAIIALSSTIALVNAQLKIYQLPVAIVLDATKLSILTVTIWRSV